METGRDRRYFEAQREKRKSQKNRTADMSSTELSDVTPLSTNSSDYLTNLPSVEVPTPWLTLPDTMAHSTVATDLSKLKQDLKALQARLRKLEESKFCNTPSTVNSCHLYIRPYNLSWSSINIARCLVLWFTRIKQYPYLVFESENTKVQLICSFTLKLHRALPSKITVSTYIKYLYCSIC